LFLIPAPETAIRARAASESAVNAAQEMVLKMRRNGVSAHRADVALQKLLEENNVGPLRRTIMEMAYSYAYGPDMAGMLGWDRVKDMWYMSCKRRAPLHGWSD